MDPKRYNRIRDLFLAAEELPPGKQEAFLQQETSGDLTLFEEVVSLLAEHDPAAARIEGDCAQPIVIPPAVGPDDIALSTVDAKPTLDTLDGLKDRESSISSQSPSVVSGLDAFLSKSGSAESGSAKLGTAESKGPRTDRAAITQQGALRTHASPRYSSDSIRSPAEQTQMPIWTARIRKSRRRASGWLWLAALLPTAIVGWFTYRAVDSTMRDSVEIKLAGAAENLSLSANRFLSNQSALVESWSRQEAVRTSISELIELARTDPPVEELRKAPQIDEIHLQLKGLSDQPNVKFVVWNNAFKIVASWLPDRADVGNSVHPNGAANLARVMAGQTVLYGPERLTQELVGFTPETSDPVMAVIVPVQNEKGKVIAAMMVRGFSTFSDFNRIFADFNISSGLDAYAIDRNGVMVTEGPLATSLATQNRFDLAADQIACNLRVCDPGVRLTGLGQANLSRQIRPVTVAVAEVLKPSAAVRTQAYPNYAGTDVVGAWRWLSPWNIGVIVEEDAADAFAPTRLVRFSFLLLGSLLSVTAFLAARKLAQTSTAEQAAVHPLSRYQVSGELGSGGMGVVYRAKHLQLGRDVALKVLRADRHRPEDRLRFDREARLAASLTSPHSVMIYDYGRSDQNEAFCVMQYLEGLTLQEVVARSGYQPIGRVLSIMRQICDALAEAHSKNLLHRDIKPQNVMLSLDHSVGDWAVVFDYGLAKPLEPSESLYQTSETIWSGTPMYMAPERFRDPGEVDPRSDIYSIGCIGYYMLAGSPPFVESDPETLFSLILTEEPVGIHIHRGDHIPSEIASLMKRCMAKDVNERFKTVVELGQTIDQLRIDHEWTIEQAKVWWSHHGGS